jgi:hypothetical protein
MWSDEQVLNSSFVYSLNRINVSVTRGTGLLPSHHPPDSRGGISDIVFPHSCRDSAEEVHHDRAGLAAVAFALRSGRSREL